MATYLYFLNIKILNSLNLKKVKFIIKLLQLLFLDFILKTDICNHKIMSSSISVENKR